MEAAVGNKNWWVSSGSNGDKMFLLGDICYAIIGVRDAASKIMGGMIGNIDCNSLPLPPKYGRLHNKGILLA